MPTKIPYLILQQEKPFEPYSIIAVGLTDNLPEDGKVQNILDHAASKIPSHVKLDVSQQVVLEPTVYMLIDPIPTFIGRPKAIIAQELGVIDKTFLDRRAGEWPSEVPLSQLGIKTEGNVGQLLVIFTLIHAESGKDVDRSLAFVQADPSSTSNAFVASRRKRQLLDHSDIVESWPSKRLKKRLPSIEELIGALKEPLVDSEKIPITERMYSSLISMLSPDKCDEDTIGTLFKIGEPDLNLIIFLSAVARSPPVGGTEKSFISFWDDNIRNPIELLIPTGKTIRNSNKHRETRKLRPDYGFLLQKICPFRGEEKGPGSSEDPKAELADKLNWVYDPAPYMLGYHCRGSEMTLAAITAPDSQRTKPNVHDLISLNLRWRKDRIANICHLINLSTILPQLAELVQSPVDDFALFESLVSNGHAVHWIREAFGHCKPLGAIGGAVSLISHALGIPELDLANPEERENMVESSYGVVTAGKYDVKSALADTALDILPGATSFASKFAYEISQYTCYTRESEGFTSRVAY